MSASKKTTPKTTKSPAPATKSSKAAAKSAPKKPTSKAAPSAEAVATAGIVAAVARAAAPAMIATPTTAAVVPSVKAAAAAVRTSITAKVDVGFGNALYIRGEGPGLSWDHGREMRNVAADLWHLELGESARPFAFKFLINDVAWSTGADYMLAPGASGTFSPAF